MAIKSKRQTYNSGICHIFNVSNVGKPGDMPVEKLKIKERLRYEERTVGMQRFTDFMQNDVEISLVIRTPRRNVVSTQDIVKLNNFVEQYRAVQIQYPRGVTPDSMDLSLERIETNYDEA